MPLLVEIRGKEFNFHGVDSFRLESTRGSFFSHRHPPPPVKCGYAGKSRKDLSNDFGLSSVYGIHFIPRSRWFGVCSASQRQMCNLLMRVCLLSEVIHFLDMGCICSKSSYENISKSKSKKKAKDKPADLDRTMCDGLTLIAF